MGLTDKDANAFFAFLAKTFFVILCLRFLMMIFGVDIGIPYLDPFLYSAIRWIKDLLGVFSLPPVHVDL